MALKNNPLDDIVKCNVEIAEPASDDASFDSILVVVAAPTATGRLTTSKAFAVSSADELLEYGYTTKMRLIRPLRSRFPRIRLLTNCISRYAVPRKPRPITTRRAPPASPALSRLSPTAPRRATGKSGSPP